ncbi:hypothetical protein AB0883_11975 [Micromonospora sp. NPDC047812]|uniref:hypothetical protein n=1 Tax=Micromonospora sp. NPDC047812 TaxID=3155742 RepID=UPI003453C10F
MRVQRLGVLVVQRAEQVGVVVADGGLLAVGASPAVAFAREYAPPPRTVQPQVTVGFPAEVFTPGSRRRRRSLTAPS